jgi:hypothetical protein
MYKHFTEKNIYKILFILLFVYEASWCHVGGGLCFAEQYVGCYRDNAHHPPFALRIIGLTLNQCLTNCRALVSHAPIYHRFILYILSVMLCLEADHHETFVHYFQSLAFAT